MIYLFISIFLILSILILGFKSNKVPLGTYIFVNIILILIATFRSPDMPDYENYYNYFTFGGAERFEIGFKTYVESVKHISINPIFIFSAIAALSVSIKLFAIRKLSPLFWGALLVYLSNIFILHDMIQIRAAVASGILLWSTKYLEERNLKYFLLSVALASLFHISSIVFLPLWFVNTTNPQKTIFLLMIPISYVLALNGITFGNIASLINIEQIQNLWNMHQNAMEHDIGVRINLFNAMHIIRLIMCTYIIANLNKIVKYDKKAIILAKIYTISLVAYNLLSDIPVIAFRISELLQVVEILLIPSILLIPYNKLINKLALICYAGCCLFINIYYNEFII